MQLSGWNCSKSPRSPSRAPNECVAWEYLFRKMSDVVEHAALRRDRTSVSDPRPSSKEGGRIAAPCRKMSMKDVSCRLKLVIAKARTEARSEYSFDPVSRSAPYSIQTA